MVDVYLNEKFIGFVDSAEEFINSLKEKRRSSKIPFNLSVNYDKEFNEVYLDSTRGRSIRLLIRVEDGKPLLTKEHIDKLASGGGYVVASSHSITDDVPPENYVAMIETAQTYGKY